MRSVLEYLESAALKSPEKIAVSMKGESLTFDQLRSVSKRIGSVICSLDKEKRNPVLVVADRKITTITYFFGVLYSGNFYVPIDPEAPDSKVQAIVDDCRPIAILGDNCYMERFEKHAEDCPFLSEIAYSTSECGIPNIGDDDPLYLIYTSGSTGMPKGVLKSHKQECNFIEAYCHTFELSEDEVIGNQTPFFFDASAKDIYLMLKLGCKLEILPTSLFSLPPELIDYLNENKVTFVSWVPTALSLVAQLNPFSVVKPTTLKRVFFVGEVMPMKHLNKWRKNLPDIEYVNLYGQTELAGICAFHRVVEEYKDDEVLPIGKPLENCKLYLIDGDKVINQQNHIGEIYIVSDALASGYYHDQEKTDSSFIEKDFGNGIVRCFKTGDLAYYNQNYELCFAARSDYQIKHMGHRIELGEIENVAGSLPYIDRCCCLYNPDKRRIVLICQLAPDTKKTSLDILRDLKNKLSNYMTPGKIIIQERLPINANGKIDRQALNYLVLKV